MASIIKVDTIQTAAGGTPTAADLGLNTTGSVLQVVKGEQSGTLTVNTSAATTYVSVSITPQSTSSKIYLTCSVMLIATNLSTSGARIRLTPQIQRAGHGVITQLNEAFQMRDYSFTSTNNETCIPCTLQVLDSPSTTSPVTYNFNVYGTQVSGNCRVSGTNVDFIAMEIAG